ncbi:MULTISPECIES: ATP-binding protein [unclassified Lentimonas]|uniref:ATP-binding protein n=1 Tax=unclassified Lentimonas TaxID=2630993 RepID=UPI0013262D33|nr:MULTISPECIES: ATP-binding protein [unclassified Lentimonas]CAA6691387.1 Unannotated [Lentimonas sp. CC10]CAA6693127.1 Unannotated [Lentimonas sp. CC19]CAA7068991.1 Unannotated [Lentimonas sp. CC11]
MKLSFKSKIALISLLITGTLLSAFGLLFFAFAYNAGLDRMDSEVRTLAESSLRGGTPPDYWENFDKSLNFIYGEQASSRITVAVSDPNQGVSFSSENAPPELVAMLSKIEVIPVERNDPFERDLFRDRSDTRGDDELYNPERGRGGRPPPRHVMPVEIEELEFQILETASGDWRVGTFRVPGMTVLMAMDMEVFYQDIHQFQSTFMIAMPMGLIVLALSGWYLAARAMRPVSMIADTAEGITAKGLSQRIPVVAKDAEIERLVVVFNGMLERLEKSYQQAINFSANAAHELQTPLTILQGELDNAIQASEDESEEQQRYSMLLGELSNLKSVAQKLLILAHADEGRLKLNKQTVDLSELIRSAGEDFEIMGPGLGVEMCVPDGIDASVDVALLNQAVRNMTSNAAKYSSDDGHVRFRLEPRGEMIAFTLSNTSPIIPAEDAALLFNRFHRVDKSRTRAGSGLGLSLAREIARAHGGDLVLADYKDGMVSFTLTLPATSDFL